MIPLDLEAPRTGVWRAVWSLLAAGGGAAPKLPMDQTEADGDTKKSQTEAKNPALCVCVIVCVCLIFLFTS